MESTFDYLLIASVGAVVTGLILQLWAEVRDADSRTRTDREQIGGEQMTSRKSVRLLGLRPGSSRLNFKRPLAPRFFSTGILRRMED
jgi:hypothetical protein